VAARLSIAEGDASVDKEGSIKPGSKVLLPLTGSGLKLLDELIEIS